METCCRAQCLAAILHTRKGIVVAGTHGKTTTSAMTAHVMREAGLDPSHYVGAEIPVLGANARWNEQGEHLVAEGDESDGTLVLYHPEHAIVLNIEAEHLDHYRDLDQIREVFGRLLDQTSGTIVCCGEDPVAREMAAGRERVLTYGWSDADYTAVDVRDLRGSSVFTVLRRGERLGEVELGIPGRHNVLNALAAIAMADSLGADFTAVARALAVFAGAKRRFETRYLSGRFRIIDDYGHHPTEIAATLATARLLGPERLVVLFQPHRYTRTQALSDDFGRVLLAADLVFVTDVYPASEPPIDGVDGGMVVEAVRRHGGTRVEYLPQLATAHHTVGNQLRPGDLLVTLGAGNVHEAGTRIAGDLEVIEELARLAADDELELALYEPMRKHTTMMVGGPAQYWIEPLSSRAFAAAVGYCRERGIPIRVVGRGSNLLVRDGGIRGAVIHPVKGEFAAVTVAGDRITAGAGVRLKRLASAAAAAGIGGFEWMEGIPGNVGGSLRMNAGAMGVEAFDQVVEVTLLDEFGAIVTKGRDEIEAHYRNVPELRRSFVLRAVFRGSPDDPEAIRRRTGDMQGKRRESQPQAASAGCVFKNPEPVPAGKLVDDLGLKGAEIGGARVSHEHGNFIVNQGGASAADVMALIEKIRREARQARGIELETEVKILGEEEFTF
jgi:UDP-N-acetylmuramate--alanine ligase